MGLSIIFSCFYLLKNRGEDNKFMTVYVKIRRKAIWNSMFAIPRNTPFLLITCLLFQKTSYFFNNTIFVPSFYLKDTL
ncbi:hypothetical protein Barb4_03399 [Bacteroidales bacterium Barb4]|nr:hypothetical protein Barb4_03399 [Bacteroidales bacterium Barb4]